MGNGNHDPEQACKGFFCIQALMSPNRYYGWRILIACFIITLYVGGTVTYGFTAFFEPIRREFHWSYTQISLASSLRGLEMGIFAPIVGFLVDRFGSRKLLLIGTIIVGIGLILQGFTQSLLMFYLCILLIGFGAGGCATLVTITAVATWFKKNVGMALGILACGLGSGGLIIPLIVFLIDTVGWRWTSMILGVGMWLIGIPLSLMVRDQPEELGRRADGSVTKLSAASDSNNGSKKTKGAFLAIIQKKSFLHLLIADAVRMMAVTAVFTHLMPYLSIIGMSRAASGAVTASLSLVSIAGRLGFGWLSDRFSTRMVWAATFFMMSAGVFAFCHVRSFWVLLLFILLFAPGYGGGMALRGAMVQKYFGMASFGKMLGVMLGVGSLGGIIGPTLAGWVFDTFGSYQMVWCGLSVITGVAIYLIIHIQPTVSSPETS